jgi:glycosyltransferase involved in cell wall biosynthesis
MRILYITLEDMSLHKGSVVHVKEIVNGLRKLGHHVGLVASSLNKSEKADCFYNLNAPEFFLLRSFRFKKQPYIVSSIFLFIYLLKILSQYDIIYARDYHTAIIALFPRLIFKKKLVFEMNGIANEEQRLKSHSIPNRILVFLIQQAEKMATKYSERIISVTPHMGVYLVEKYNCAPDKVIAITNAVNTKKFYPIHDDALLEQLKQRLGVTKKEIVIAFVGNLAPWQGVEKLIEVAPLLLKKNGNIRFLIIGDGILKDEFKGMVNKLGLLDRFIFTGMIDYDEIPLYINIADICVLPKRKLRSGYSPIKLYEYMACSKPVVASRVEGLEFIEEEGIGRLVEPEDVLGLEKTIDDLIKRPEERIRMGEKGHQIAREGFSWESRVKKLEEILKELA